MNGVTIAIVSVVAAMSLMINDAVAQHEEETGARITEEGTMIIDGIEQRDDEDESRRGPAAIGASEVEPYYAIGAGEVEPYYAIGAGEVEPYERKRMKFFSGGQWAVYLNITDRVDEKTWPCGGSLVDPEVEKEALEGFNKVKWNANNSSARWVITAAHCLIGFSQRKYLRKHYSPEQRGEYQIRYVEPADIEAITGTLDVLDVQNENSGEVRKIIAVMIHDEFDPVSMQNDIALLLLNEAKKPLPMTKRGSIRLADDRDDEWINKPYLAMTLQGWGTTSQIISPSKPSNLLPSKPSNLLLEVVIPLVDNDTCDSAFKTMPGMICGGFYSGGYGSCKGDSGGPLVIKPSKEPGVLKIKEPPVLIGVVSGGNPKGCATKEGYSFYASVISFRPWLDQKVKECDVKSLAGCS